ncbi:unnamed protein product, partial [marine sediment metagenome]
QPMAWRRIHRRLKKAWARNDEIIISKIMRDMFMTQRRQLPARRSRPRLL